MIQNNSVVHVVLNVGIFISMHLWKKQKTKLMHSNTLLELFLLNCTMLHRDVSLILCLHFYSRRANTASTWSWLICSFCYHSSLQSPIAFGQSGQTFAIPIRLFIPVFTCRCLGWRRALFNNQHIQCLI